MKSSRDPVGVVTLECISGFRRVPALSADEVFARLEEEPLGAASLAQCHKGVLKDGRIVAVKIQRPDVRENSSVDMDTIDVSCYSNGKRNRRSMGKAGNKRCLIYTYFHPYSSLSGASRRHFQPSSLDG